MSTVIIQGFNSKLLVTQGYIPALNIGSPTAETYLAGAVIGQVWEIGEGRQQTYLPGAKIGQVINE